MTKTCKVCGETKPLEDFPKKGIYRLNTCKSCTNKRNRGKYKKASEATKAKNLLRGALRREKLKCEHGNTYSSEKEAARARAYSSKYAQEHKGDPIRMEKKRKYSRNAWERKKIKDEVAFLSEFFTCDEF